MTIPLKYEDVVASLELANREKEIAVSLSVDLKAERDAALAREALLKRELEIAAEQVCSSEDREAALREELDLLKPALETTFDAAQQVRSERDSLQQRLTVAEQRVGDAFEIAAQWVDNRRDEYVNEHGSNDPETGTVEFPGNGEEYVGELTEIAEGLRALKPAAESAIEVARQSLSFENQRIQPARFHCLACGEYHEGSGNLPCPKMKPMSGVKP